VKQKSNETCPTHPSTHPSAPAVDEPGRPHALHSTVVKRLKWLGFMDRNERLRLLANEGG
jgi:hypothetical protein